MNIEKFKELKTEGWNNQKIADYFNVSLSTLKRFIKANSLTKEKKEIDYDQFLKLYNENKKDEEIALILDIAKTKISNYRKSLNLPSITDKIRKENQQKFLILYKEGKSDSEIARILQVNHVTIHNWRNELIGEKSNFEYARKFDTTQFLQLYNQGLNYKEIADILLVSDSAIQNYASSLNLTPNTYNKDVPTYTQQQIIIGSLLGDMSLKMPKDSIHASGDFAHSLKQENYCKYIESELSNFCSKGFYKSYIDKRTNKRYDQYYVYMKASEYLTTLYYKFYPNGKKIVPKDLLYSLDGLGLAIWFMDDGYKSDSTYHLSTNCFSVEDLKVIIEFFKIKFNITATYNKSHVIRIASKSANIFKNLIKDFIHEDCLYKL
jgi:transposase